LKQNDYQNVKNSGDPFEKVILEKMGRKGKAFRIK